MRMYYLHSAFLKSPSANIRLVGHHEQQVSSLLKQIKGFTHSWKKDKLLNTFWRIRLIVNDDWLIDYTIPIQEYRGRSAFRGQEWGSPDE